MLICHSGSTSIEMDLIGGRVLMNGKEPKSVWDIRTSQVYKELYPELADQKQNKRDIAFSMLSEDKYAGVDPFGYAITAIRKEHSFNIYRELKLGEKQLGSFRYITLGHVPNYLPKLQNHRVWINEATKPNSYAYVDPLNGKVMAHISLNGHFYFLEDPETPYEMVNLNAIPDYESLAAFNKETRLWQEADKPVDSAKMRLEFPNYFYPENEPLQFERKKDPKTNHFFLGFKRKSRNSPGIKAACERF